MILPLAVACIALGLLNIINQITMGFMRKTIDLQRRTIATQAASINSLRTTMGIYQDIATVERRINGVDIDGEARTINWMSERKYIILKDAASGKEYAVIFDRDLSHVAVEHGIAREMRGNEWGQRMHLDAVSAGFVDSALVVFPGRGSESLKLAPRAVDQIVINGGQPMSDAAKAAVAEIARKITAPKRSMLDRARSARGR